LAALKLTQAKAQNIIFGLPSKLLQLIDFSAAIFNTATALSHLSTIAFPLLCPLGL
jgi:hypothetical protein